MKTPSVREAAKKSSIMARPFTPPPLNGPAIKRRIIFFAASLTRSVGFWKGRTLIKIRQGICIWPEMKYKSTIKYWVQLLFLRKPGNYKNKFKFSWTCLNFFEHFVQLQLSSCCGCCWLSSSAVVCRGTVNHHSNIKLYFSGQALPL